MTKHIPVSTSRKVQVMDITSIILNEINIDNLNNGLLTLYCPHSTAAITINEPESNLISDFENYFNDVFDPKQSYAHNRIDNNARAHLISGLIGASLSIPILNNNLILGTWQGILFLEFDGPRNRNIYFNILKGD